MYGNATSLVGQTAERIHIANYMKESLETYEGSSIWGKLFYKEDIPAVDPLTGASYKKTITFTKKQGAGGVGNLSKGLYQNVAQPGNIGMMIPSAHQIQIGTSLKYTTIGRTWQDSLIDQKGLYEVIKANAMGTQITEALTEMTKAAIYQAADKTVAYTGTGTAPTIDGLNDIESAEDHKLTWKAVREMVSAKETRIVSIRNNHERANDSFIKAVRTVVGNDTGADGAVTGAESDFSQNLVDTAAWTAAQEAFAQAFRTERQITPRYQFTGLEVSNYKSEFVDVDSITFTLPDYNTLYNGNMRSSMSRMLVLTGNKGYNQLFDDKDFQDLIAVSGYGLEQGLSGRHMRHVLAYQAIDIQGIVIVNMQEDEIKPAVDSANAILNGGVSFGDSVNANGIVFSTALTAVPGLNFITRATEGIGTNGVRVVTKKLEQATDIDRFGFNEFTNMLFAWDVEIKDPTAFSLLIHAE